MTLDESKPQFAMMYYVDKKENGSGILKSMLFNLLNVEDLKLYQSYMKRTKDIKVLDVKMFKDFEDAKEDFDMGMKYSILSMQSMIESMEAERYRISQLGTNGMDIKTQSLCTFKPIVSKNDSKKTFSN